MPVVQRQPEPPRAGQPLGRLLAAQRREPSHKPGAQLRVDRTLLVVAQPAPPGQARRSRGDSLVGQPVRVCAVEAVPADALDPSPLAPAVTGTGRPATSGGREAGGQPSRRSGARLPAGGRAKLGDAPLPGETAGRGDEHGLGGRVLTRDPAAGPGRRHLGPHPDGLYPLALELGQAHLTQGAGDGGPVARGVGTHRCRERVDEHAEVPRERLRLRKLGVDLRQRGRVLSDQSVGGPGPMGRFGEILDPHRGGRRPGPDELVPVRVVGGGGSRRLLDLFPRGPAGLGVPASRLRLAEAFVQPLGLREPRGVLRGWGTAVGDEGHDRGDPPRRVLGLGGVDAGQLPSAGLCLGEQPHRGRDAAQPLGLLGLGPGTRPLDLGPLVGAQCRRPGRVERLRVVAAVPRPLRQRALVGTVPGGLGRRADRDQPAVELRRAGLQGLAEDVVVCPPGPFPRFVEDRVAGAQRRLDAGPELRGGAEFAGVRPVARHAEHEPLLGRHEVAPRLRSGRRRLLVVPPELLAGPVDLGLSPADGRGHLVEERVGRGGVLQPEPVRRLLGEPGEDPLELLLGGELRGCPAPAGPGRVGAGLVRGARAQLVSAKVVADRGEHLAQHVELRQVAEHLMGRLALAVLVRRGELRVDGGAGRGARVVGLRRGQRDRRGDGPQKLDQVRGPRPAASRGQDRFGDGVVRAAPLPVRLGPQGVGRRCGGRRRRQELVDGGALGARPGVVDLLRVVVEVCPYGFPVRRVVGLGRAGPGTPVHAVQPYRPCEPGRGVAHRKDLARRRVIGQSERQGGDRGQVTRDIVAVEVVEHVEHVRHMRVRQHHVRAGNHAEPAAGLPERLGQRGAGRLGGEGEGGGPGAAHDLLPRRLRRRLAGLADQLRLLRRGDLEARVVRGAAQLPGIRHRPPVGLTGQPGGVGDVVVLAPFPGPEHLAQRELLRRRRPGRGQHRVAEGEVRCPVRVRLLRAVVRVQDVLAGLRRPCLKPAAPDEPLLVHGLPQHRAYGGVALGGVAAERLGGLPPGLHHEGRVAARGQGVDQRLMVRRKLVHQGEGRDLVGGERVGVAQAGRRPRLRRGEVLVRGGTGERGLTQPPQVRLRALRPGALVQHAVGQHGRLRLGQLRWAVVEQPPVRRRRPGPSLVGRRDLGGRQHGGAIARHRPGGAARSRRVRGHGWAGQPPGLRDQCHGLGEGRGPRGGQPGTAEMVPRQLVVALLGGAHLRRDRRNPLDAVSGDERGPERHLPLGAPGPPQRDLRGPELRGCGLRGGLGGVAGRQDLAGERELGGRVGEVRHVVGGGPGPLGPVGDLFPRGQHRRGEPAVLHTGEPRQGPQPLDRVDQRHQLVGVLRGDRERVAVRLPGDQVQFGLRLRLRAGATQLVDAGRRLGPALRRFRQAPLEGQLAGQLDRAVVVERLLRIGRRSRTGVAVRGRHRYGYGYRRGIGRHRRGIGELLLSRLRHRDEAAERGAVVQHRDRWATGPAGRPEVAVLADHVEPHLERVGGELDDEVRLAAAGPPPGLSQVVGEPLRTGGVEAVMPPERLVAPIQQGNLVGHESAQRRERRRPERLRTPRWTGRLVRRAAAHHPVHVRRGHRDDRLEQTVCAVGHVDERVGLRLEPVQCVLLGR
ncbi:hypothetical protein GCM10007977_001350 [Dactylosporangium sucinum]|uniref:Uncharacterized protein n=1 Tax=Dactylosporangium sucinum TaxID=1424081 RepID=A0A917SZD1_9ACTN|nr:hypothetical protein GCM10007977_001350 [Dactylosporangium sucinum]